MSNLEPRYAFYSILVSSALLIGTVFYREYGFGIRDRIVEYPFREKGVNMTVVRVDKKFANDDFYVETFDPKINLREGMSVSQLEAKHSGVKIFNYSGRSDAGEDISVRLEGWSVNQNKRIKHLLEAQ